MAVGLAVQREAGPGPLQEEIARFNRLQERLAQKTEPGEPQTDPRLVIACDLLAELKAANPTVDQGPSAEAMAKSRLQAAASAIFARMEPLYPQTLPGTVSEESIAGIEAVLRDARQLIAATAADAPGLPGVVEMVAGIQRMLAGCYRLAGRPAEALTAFATAAADFAASGNQAQASRCKDEAAKLQQALSGNLDAAAAVPLASLHSAQSAGDALDRIEALMQLADVAREAGDSFETNQRAEAAAALLCELGFLDPGQCGAEAAMDSWIGTAAATHQGTGMLGRLSRVEAWYHAIVSSRQMLLLTKDPATAAQVEALGREIENLNAQSQHEAQAAEGDAMDALRRYYPGASPVVAAQPQATPAVRFRDRSRMIDDALLAISNECNARLANGGDDAMEDLLERTHKLQALGDELHMPEYEAKTRLEEAYVLYQLGRGPDVVRVAREARQRLLAGKPATLASFPSAHQRYLYLDSLDRELQGQIMAGTAEASLEIAEATIKDFESERYHVNSEYRQSAMLSYVADFYKWAALLAFKLQRWDNMLAAIDLIKARSAVRNRLTPDPPESFGSEVEREFEALSCRPKADQTPEDLNRRRQLWDLLSIQRAQNAKVEEVPLLTVASLQAALADDEALISYFWLNETVLLTVAVGRDSFHAERILLQPDQAALLEKFVNFLQHLRTSQKINFTLAKLGAVLLPGFLRDFLRSKKRVLFSPHHQLHLFPFHAVPWEDEFVGTAFAVGYVPNFSSVLLPWRRHPADAILSVGIASFADPSVPPLPNIEEDAISIGEAYRATGAAVRTALGRDATRLQVQAMKASGELGSFRCIHLGTHGLSVFERPEEPLESRLLLQDGDLDAMDIADLRLNAEVVVMGACHSGERAIKLRNLGEVPGDDIFGLQSALFKAGVRAMVGALWIVETRSASAMVRGFHRHFAAGETVEEALQSALKDYLADGSYPRDAYYWAPFFVSSLGRRQTGVASWQN